MSIIYILLSNFRALLKHGTVRNKPERSVPFRDAKTRNALITDHRNLRNVIKFAHAHAPLQCSGLSCSHAIYSLHAEHLCIDAMNN